MAAVVATRSCTTTRNWREVSFGKNPPCIVPAPGSQRSFLSRVCDGAPPHCVIAHRSSHGCTVPQHDATENANAEHIGPTGRKIEQMRQEQRGSHVRNHESEPEPRRHSAAA